MFLLSRQRLRVSCCASNKPEKCFVVHNKFHVKHERVNEFEHLLKTTARTAGLISFQLIQNKECSSEYISQTVWKDKHSFKEWIESSTFGKCHDMNYPDLQIHMRDLITDVPETNFYELKEGFQK